MKKKILFSIILAAAITAATTLTALAGDVRVRLDGAYVDVDAVIVNDRTLLPARDIVEMLGGRVYWDEEPRQVRIYHGETRVLLTIDSPVAYVDGKAVELDVAPQLINDKTKVPLRFVAESLGVDVDFYDGTVFITTPQTAASGLVASTEHFLTDGTVLVIIYTPVVARGETANVFFVGPPYVDWYLSIRYASGYGRARGLGLQTADSEGLVEWTWMIGSRTEPGDWPVSIYGNGELITFYLTVAGLE